MVGDHSFTLFPTGHLAATPATADDNHSLLGALYSERYCFVNVDTNTYLTSAARSLLHLVCNYEFGCLKGTSWAAVVYLQGL